jgi:CBS-domain-containing membrane protein
MKTVRVFEVSRQTPLQSLVIRADTALEIAINHLAKDHALHGLFLVDDEQRLIGVVNNHDLLDWSRIQLDVRLPITQLSLGQIRRLVLAERARDLARAGSENAAVREDDTLADALTKMSRYGLTSIPVLDEDRRIVNDLRLSEVLAVALQQKEQEPPPEGKGPQT